MSKSRSTFEQFRHKALRKPGVRAEYEALAPMYEMKRRMIAMRKEAGVTQEQMAQLLGTKKSNISRLESMSSAASPRLSTVDQYARALGYRIKVEFVNAASSGTRLSAGK